MILFALFYSVMLFIRTFAFALFSSARTFLNTRRAPRMVAFVLSASV